MRLQGKGTADCNGTQGGQQGKRSENVCFHGQSLVIEALVATPLELAKNLSKNGVVNINCDLTKFSEK